jgi:hypothetical protein
LRPTPSVLHRAGTALCFSVLVCVAVSGCAPKKSADSSPSAAASIITNPHYGPSAALAANLAAPAQVIGDIQGTMTVDADKRPLSGTVMINGSSTHVLLVEGGAVPETFAEIVVDGHRYTSPDNTIWIDRGTKAPGTGLVTLLATADTSRDAGVSKVGDVSAHKILTAADKLDVATALGLDIWTFDRETTTLRIWADDKGKPLGFGAYMSWRVMLGGAYKEVTVELDVVFTSTDPVKIVAPTAPWKWSEHKEGGFAYGYPTTGVSAKVEWNWANAGDKTLSQVAKEFVDALTGTPSGSQSILIGSEDALWMTLERTKQKDHAVIAIVVHETESYTILIYGALADAPKLDVLAQKIFSTVEFTR